MSIERSWPRRRHADAMRICAVHSRSISRSWEWPPRGFAGFRLNRVQTFRKVTAQENEGFHAADAFHLADDCLGMLDDVMSEALEAEPRLAKWSRREPTYYKWFEGAVPYHFLGFRFQDRNWRTWFGAEFVFPETSGPLTWRVAGRSPRSGERSYERKLSAVCRPGGILDRERMLRSFLGGAKRLGVIRRNKWCRQWRYFRPHID